MYQHHKDLLQYNDNFNHYVTHEGVEEKQLEEFHASLYSVDTRLDGCIEKAKEDHTFRTDIPKEVIFRCDSALIIVVRRPSLRTVLAT